MRVGSGVGAAGGGVRPRATATPIVAAMRRTSSPPKRIIAAVLPASMPGSAWRRCQAPKAPSATRARALTRTRTPYVLVRRSAGEIRTRTFSTPESASTTQQTSATAEKRRAARPGCRPPATRWVTTAASPPTHTAAASTWSSRLLVATSWSLPPAECPVRASGRSPASATPRPTTAAPHPSTKRVIPRATRAISAVRAHEVVPSMPVTATDEHPGVEHLGHRAAVGVGRAQRDHQQRRRGPGRGTPRRDADRAVAVGREPARRRGRCEEGRQHEEAHGRGGRHLAHRPHDGQGVDRDGAGVGEPEAGERGRTRERAQRQRDHRGDGEQGRDLRDEQRPGGGGACRRVGGRRGRRGHASRVGRRRRSAVRSG